MRKLFSHADTPCAPYTTGEVAESLDCSERQAERSLAELAERGELRVKEPESGVRVWWRPPGGTDVDDQRPRLREFGAFVNAVKDYAIFMLDPNGTVASWNRGAERIKGYSADEIVGEHFSTFYTEEDTAEGVPETNLETARAEGRVEYSGEEPPHVHVGAERIGDAWTLSVRDEGIGIDAENVDRVFEVFQRLHGNGKYGGTGIGLALCERIVDRHGGEIWVESEPGEGSTFYVTLPAADE